MFGVAGITGSALFGHQDTVQTLEIGNFSGDIDMTFQASIGHDSAQPGGGVASATIVF
jgi:hypothetical protein